MDTPGDGDGSSSDDGLIAKVIPLRRRDSGDTWAPPFHPPVGDVFEPPEDPEPLGEYSVWETPTAELIRREPARRPTSASGYLPRFPPGAGRLLALAALGAVSLVVVMVIVLPLGRNAHAPVTVGQVSTPPGLGQALGGVTSSRSSRRTGVASERHARKRIGAAASGRHGTPAPRPAASERVAPAVSDTVSVAYSPPSSSPQTASVTTTPAVAAAREFGFER